MKNVSQPMKQHPLRRKNQPRWEPSRSSWWDVWLPRLSLISQFGLFVFTVGTIYFTVIPLYQKALLEEAIAQKEVEYRHATQTLEAKEAVLKKTQTELNEKITQLNSAQVAFTRAEQKSYMQQRQYELSAFIRSAALECSGLSERPKEPVLLGKEAIGPFHEKVFSINPGQCVRNQYLSSSLRRTVLNAEDQTAGDGAIEKLVQYLVRLKKSAQVEVTELPLKAKNDPKILRPMTGYSAQVEAFLENAAKQLNPSTGERSIDRLIAWNQNEIARQYRESLLKAVAKLRDLQWSTKQPA